MTDYDEVLDGRSAAGVWRQPKLLRGVFSILLVSFLMTIFETLFYRFLVEPQTRAAGEQALVLLRRTAQDAASPVKFTPSGLDANGLFDSADLDKLGGPYDPVLALLRTAEAREAATAQRINRYAYVTASFMLVLLLWGMSAVDHRLAAAERGKTAHALRLFAPQFHSALLTSVLTVVLLAAFQVNFYLFGLRFNYLGIGADGEAEILFAVVRGLRKNLGMPALDAA